MKTLLIVDSDPAAPTSLAQLLEPACASFETRCAPDAAHALEFLEHTPCDFVVAGPGQDETQDELFRALRRQHPRTVRLLVAGAEEAERATRLASDVHQTLSRESSTQALRGALLRGAALHDVLTSAPLQRLVSNSSSLPSMPNLYGELVEAMKSPDCTVEGLGAIIARDIGMTARVLKIVNSASFGLREKISSPGQAATFLGLDTLRSLVLSVGVFSQFDGTESDEFSVQETWEHSMRVANFTRAILAAEGADKRTLEEGFLAGMMHDCGQMVMAKDRAGRFRAVQELARRDRLDASDTERRIFGASHASLGAWLLGEWGMSTGVVEAVCFHHAPELGPERGFGVLTALHAANSIAEANLDLEEIELRGLQLAYLGELELEGRLPDWIASCRSSLEQGSAAPAGKS